MARRSSRGSGLGPARGQVATSINVPAPTRGWVTSVPLADMPPDSAILLINFFPEVDGVAPRGGAEYHGAAFSSSPVESLFSWQSGASKKLFAAAGTAIYDITDPAAITTAVTGLSNARWEAINFDGSGGPQLLIFNGVDAPRRFNGTAWSLLTFTTGGIMSGGGTPTAFDGSGFTGGVTFASRLFLIKGTALYYPPVDSFQGDLGVLQVGNELAKGGSLVALGRWTSDAGLGPQDRLVAVSSEGEVVTYQGNNPSDANNWSVTGKYQAGLPIGKRCVVKLGGDLGILTRDGVQAMSKITTLDRAQADGQGAFSSNIRSAFKETADFFGNVYGWQVLVYPERSMLIVNIPVTEYTDAQQYVMNVQTGAWTRFVGWKAVCFHAFNGKLYFGLAGGRIGVTTASTSLTPTEGVSTDLGEVITCRLIGAFTAIGGRGRGKLVKMIRPVMISDASINYWAGVCFDYKLAVPFSFVTPQVFGNPNGGVALVSDIPLQAWGGASGYGFAIAPTLNLNFQSDSTPPHANFTPSARLIGFDVLVEAGGML